MKAVDVVRQVRKIASALKQAAVWHGSALPVDATKADYLYELRCYFLAANAARKDFVVKHHGSKKSPKHARWPKKPGKKANFSFLMLKHKSAAAASYQLCPGITVTDIHGKGRAPDINLLTGGCSDEPTYAELLGCWDAKYVSDPKARVPDTCISDFVYTVEELGGPTPPSHWVAATGVEFALPGILTNGDQSTETDAALKKRGVSETSRYPDQPHTRP